MLLREKKRWLILLLAAWGIASVAPAWVASAASVGFYAATFDPPTRSQLRMMHCVLGNTSLHRACEEFGKSISRLIVTVLEDDQQDGLASTRERVLMLRKALQGYGDRVEVVASTGAQAEERKQALLDDSNTDRLFQIITGDAYERLRTVHSTADARLGWLVFPLEGDGGFPVGRMEARAADPGVTDVVETLGLYSDVSPDLAHLQLLLFEEGWKDFLNDLKAACPGVIHPKACADLAPRWDAVAIVAVDPLNNVTAATEPAVGERLVYRKFQSEDRWAEKFVQTALRFVDGDEDRNKLETVAEDMAARMFQGYPLGRLPRLRTVSSKGGRSSPENFNVSKKAVMCSTPVGSYHADMDQYLADRFPRAFSAFLREDARRRSNQPVELFVHNQPLEAAYTFHRRHGYADFYFLQTRRGQLHRDIYLAVKSQPRAYRLVLTGVRGTDRRANVFCQLQRTALFPHYYEVEARRGQHLFVLNTEGNSLKLKPEDVLLFGFKGNWTRRLLARDWRRQPLVEEGLDIDLFTHPTIKHRLVVARNVYGDDGDIILDTFYKKGMRQVIYLGTAGAVADYRVGDVVIPNEFTDRHHKVVAFANNLARGHQSGLASFVNVYVDKKQGWVQSLFDETIDLLLEWRAKSVVSVDIEGLHLANFAKAHPDLRMAALFVISDETLGAATIEETMALRGRIDESVDKVISVLFPEVANPK
ncbi:MAG: hypothetical protein ABW172_17145 [Candidatus Binatia bacterium]